MSTMKAILGLASVSGALALVAPRQDVRGTATVKVAEPSGTPEHWASGFIYGFPSNGDGSASDAIPSDLVEGMGFNYCRAGGAQMANALGWVAGQYEGRFMSALSNYRTTREYGGRFTLLMHDLWGADGKQGDGIKWPGDNGDWTEYDSFLDTVFGDLKANDALDGLDIDIWNEPDISGFWDTTQEQYLATWNRTWHRIREELPGTVITGPSTAFTPASDNGWWVNFMAYVDQTNTIPDQWSWHLIGSAANVRQSTAGLNYFVDQYGFPELPIVMNEYGKQNGEQNPAGAVYFIGQLERANTAGLRSNWASGAELQDLMANLVVKQDDGTYLPTGEWFVYSYYAETMTGQRVATTASADEIFEVYATRENGKLKILASVRPNASTGRYDLTLTGLDALGVQGDSITVRTLRFDGPDAYTVGSAPTDMGVWDHPVQDNSVTFWVEPQVNTAAYAFEI
ncbi:glycoside hydrolase superfamily [Emericellopsis atlantica]|uniref:Glycoside hydrolase superfamily n=1 Tax=Emericellopsis atlantica TaxID=2614577 RepID=A0A9P7ZVZ6_9HYPO|nr:glycoside hydrolase superfamily [Emericellopsis atlantica]KAG9258831.1 glycoside hydrolase superfamily [Emericellopsis atlantica]